MSGAGSAADGAGHAADDGACPSSPGHGERQERRAACLPPKKSSWGAAAGASEASQDVKGVDSTSAEPTAGAHDAGAVDVGKNMLDEISELKRKQKEARDAKLTVGKELRNAERRRKRLKLRAKQLSDEDLLAVMSLRTHEKAQAQRKGNSEEEASVHPDASSTSQASSAGTYSSTTKARRG